MRLGVLVALGCIGAVVSSGACSNFKGGSIASGDDGGEGGASSGSGSSSGAGGSSGGGSGSGSGSGGSSGGSGSGGGSGGGSGSSSGTSGSSSGGSGSSSGGDAGSVAYGAGPEGALPSGYCCTSDEDCRNRYCVDLGGGNKMCEDECDGSQSACQGLLPGFTCTWDDAMVDGFCEPMSPTTQCVPADQYQHGTKPDGACCSATGDATSGQECLSGNCGAFGDQSNPYICNLACDATRTCPGTALCSNVGVYSVCAPLANMYTCQ
jgi:hypothetical protein